MRVRLCDNCPYVPADVATHYDPAATIHLCAGCDDRPATLTNHYPREQRRPRASLLLEMACARSRELA